MRIYFVPETSHNPYFRDIPTVPARRCPKATFAGIHPSVAMYDGNQARILFLGISGVTPGVLCTTVRLTLGWQGAREERDEFRSSSIKLGKYHRKKKIHEGNIRRPYHPSLCKHTKNRVSACILFVKFELLQCMHSSIKLRFFKNKLCLQTSKNI